jgi:hypothetical protein
VGYLREYLKSIVTSGITLSRRDYVGTNRKPVDRVRRPARVDTLPSPRNRLTRLGLCSAPNELHRYFPEWADRRPRNGTPREAVRNCYLAGGYAEEFGYCLPVDSLAALPPLAGDPEHSLYWYVQIGALHPGYPQCARPAERFDRDQGPSAPLCARPEAIASARASAHASAPKTEVEICVVQVGHSDRNPNIGAHGLALLWKELRIRRRMLESLF